MFIRQRTIIIGVIIITLAAVSIMALKPTFLLRVNNLLTPPAKIRLQAAIEQRQPAPTKVINRAAKKVRAIVEAPVELIAPQPKILTVPFTPQAPFGDWTDPRQQDGCEEAALVMAWHWLKGTDLTRERALEEILALSRWSEEHLNEWRSTSANDTARLFKERYGYDKISVSHDIAADDLKRELAAGNLVLVPTDGTKLGNPYYRQPGPPEHMLILLGYDEWSDEFITNDPGTKRGQGYHYKSAVLEQALVDYPTGHREPNPNPRTAMIVIAPNL